MNPFNDIKVFVVSLLRRNDRRHYIAKELDALGISFRFWAAIEMQDGAEGLKRTMKALLEHCIATNIERVMVLEDDATLCGNIDLVPEVLEQLPKDFDLFYFGCNLLLIPDRISKNVLKVNAAYATYAILYSKRGMEKVLTLLEGGTVDPYDVFINRNGNVLSRYCSYPMLFTQRIGVSDIYKPTKEELDQNLVIKEYYNVKTQEIDWGKFMKENFERMTKNLLYAEPRKEMPNDTRY